MSENFPIRLTAELPWVWRHQCGVLNEGSFHSGNVCSGCRFTVDNPAEVEARYLLVEVGS